MCPAAVYLEIRDGKGYEKIDLGFIIEEWLSGLISALFIATIVYGIKYNLKKGKKFYTLLYKMMIPQLVGQV